METICSDNLKHIIGFCELPTLFCLQFVNKMFRYSSRKNMRIINKIRKSDNNTLCDDAEICGYMDPLIEVFYYEDKQLEIANGLAPFGVEVLNWMYDLYPKWLLPEYCYAMDVETLEFIQARLKYQRTLGVRLNYCPPREVLEWMICTSNPQILGFELNELAINKHYDLLKNINYYYSNNNYNYQCYNQYELLCWMIDTNIPIEDEYDILPFLAGGGKRYICDITNRDVRGSGYKCRNVGAERVKQAIAIGYIVKWCSKETRRIKGTIGEALYVAATEANNIELLDYIHEKAMLPDAHINSLLSVALEENHYEATKWIIEHYDINRNIQLFCSNVKILLFLKDKGFVWDNSVYINAIKDHDLNLIKYFHENKVQWDTVANLNDVRHYGLPINISEYIVKSGNVGILQSAIAKGCPLSSDCNKYSSTIPMIKYLTSLGYPPVSCTLCSLKNNLDGVKWLCRTGIEFDYNHVYECSIEASIDVKYWLLKHRKELIVTLPIFL